MKELVGSLFGVEGSYFESYLGMDLSPRSSSRPVVATFHNEVLLTVLVDR